MTCRAVAAAAFMAAFLCAPPAVSAAQCAPTQQMMPALERTGETIVWRGLAGAHLVLLMMHHSTRAWTIVGTSPQSVTCVVAHGQDGELITIGAKDVRARTPRLPDRERPPNDHR